MRVDFVNVNMHPLETRMMDVIPRVGEYVNLVAAGKHGQVVSVAWIFYDTSSVNDSVQVVLK